MRQLKNAVERLVLKATSSTIDVRDLPEDLRLKRSARIEQPAAAAAGPSIVSDLLTRMLEQHESFWSVVYTPFMERDLTRAQLTELISHGLERTAGNYRSLVELFNMPLSDYKKFLAFLSKHRCHLPFRAYRSAAPAVRRAMHVEAGTPHAHAVGM